MKPCQVWQIQTTPLQLSQPVCHQQEGLSTFTYQSLLLIKNISFKSGQRQAFNIMLLYQVDLNFANIILKSIAIYVDWHLQDICIINMHLK